MNNIYEWAHKYGIAADAVIDLLDIMDPTRTHVTSAAHGSEAAVQSALRLEAARRGCILWRNNNGAAEIVDESNPSAPARHVRFGLGNDSEKINKVFKSPDLVGIMPVTIAQKDVGTVIGKYFEVEVKKPGWKAPTNDRERAQGAHLSYVKAMGGVAMFAQSVEDVFV